MDPRTPDGIIPGAQREGFTDRPPPRLALPSLPDPEVTVGGRLVLRAFLHIAGLAVANAVCFPVFALVAIGGSLSEEVVEGLFWATAFPLRLLYAVAEPILPDDWAWLYPLNSLLWAATVYGLFLAGRWAYRRLRPGQAERLPS